MTTTVDIVDFSDLADEDYFRFKGVTYVIPAIGNKKAKQLLSLWNSTGIKKEDAEKASEGDMDKTILFFDMQVEFIYVAITDESGSEVDKEVISNWPMKMLSKVIEKINAHMALSVGADEEKKSSPNAENTSK